MPSSNRNSVASRVHRLALLVGVAALGTAGQALASPVQYSDYAVYVSEQLTLEPGAHVERGAIGAASSTGEITLQEKASVSSQHLTRGHRVVLEKGSIVGAVDTSQLQDNGGLHGLVSPLPPMPVLPVRPPPPPLDAQ